MYNIKLCLRSSIGIFFPFRRRVVDALWPWGLVGKSPTPVPLLEGQRNDRRVACRRFLWVEIIT